MTENSFWLLKKERKQKELLEKINVGDVIEGTVKNVTDFGAFIDLGGADGLLHISEMSWGRVDNPKKVSQSWRYCKSIYQRYQRYKDCTQRKIP